MRESIRELLCSLAGCLPIEEPIVEFGAFQVPGQEGFADLRPLFPGKTYIGTDVREGPGVDRVLDLHDIDLPTGSVGTALIIDTLEHVEYARRALQEVHRVLRPGGMVVITSVMDFPRHGHPHDYWRFTPEGLASLLRPFASSVIEHAGDDSFPHTVVGLGFKGEAPELQAFLDKLEEWKRNQAALSPLASGQDAARKRKHWHKLMAGAALAGLLAICYHLGSALPIAGLVLSATFGTGVSYLLGYYLANRGERAGLRRRCEIAGLAVLVTALALVLPHLPVSRYRAFALWH
nr:methyltransferase domain-containing protein [Gemmatimonadales bacterium]